jgi:hypothetical protein
MTNYPFPSMHQSLDPFCIPFSVPKPSVNDTIQNNLHGESPTYTTPSRFHQVPIIPLGMVIQFRALEENSIF